MIRPLARAQLFALLPFVICAALSPDALASDEAVEPRVSRSYRPVSEESTALARAELIGGQAIHGAAFGLQACMAFECDAGASYAISSALGAGAGVTGSVLLTRRGVTPGRANAINSGTLWGGWMGLGGAVLARTNHRTAMGAMMAGQLFGGGAGYALSELWQPRAGDVALVNAAGTWSAALYFLVGVRALDTKPSPRVGVGSLVGASLVGGSAGGLLARYAPMSRGRVALISGSGLLGAATGYAAMMLIRDSEGQDRVVSATAAAGAVAGLGLGALLTRHLDDAPVISSRSIALTILPTRRGQGAIGALSLRH